MNPLRFLHPIDSPIIRTSLPVVLLLGLGQPTQSLATLTGGRLGTNRTIDPELEAVEFSKSSRSLEFTQLPSISANPNPRVPLAALLQFATREPVETIVEVRNTNPNDRQSAWTLNFDTTQDPQAGLAIVGMRPNSTYELTIAIQDSAGNQTPAPQTLRFTTPPVTLNTDTFPPLDVRTSKPERMEPGITLLSMRRQKATQGDPAIGKFNQKFGLLLALDAAGEPVWYYEADSRISDFEVLHNGHIAYVTQDYRIIEIDLLGNTVHTWWAKNRPQGATAGTPIETTTLHHDLDQLPNGNLIALGTEQRTIENYYTSETDANAPRATQEVMGDLIIEFAPDGSIPWSWNAFDWLDPFRIGYETFQGYWHRRGFPNVLDWTHFNNVVYNDRDDSILASSRYLSAILKIDRATGELIWIVGNPIIWPDSLQSKTFTLAGAAEGKTRWFFHQHSPEPSHNGTLLLYDNGSYQAFPFDPPAEPAETYSRAVEYRLDETTRTLTQVWSSERPGEAKVIGFAMGDVDSLPETDNILLSEGWLLPPDKIQTLTWDEIPDDTGWTRIREYTHTTPPNILWEVVMDNGSAPEALGWLIFSSERVSFPFRQP
ncbi:MAG: aryl-sulfate sulfotransferase [Prochlorotrichaceae cyanobacterium]|jgi:hypothetical protein